MTAVLAVRPAAAVREPFAFLKRVTFALNVWLALGGGASDAAEFREWLEMTGMLAEAGPEARAVPAEKYCPGCETVKPASEWHRNAGHPDGLASYCKSCTSAKRKPATEADLTARRDAKRDRYARSREGKPDRRLKENRPAVQEPEQVTVRLPAELASLLADEAAAGDTSMSAIVRDMLAARYGTQDRRAS